MLIYDGNAGVVIWRVPVDLGIIQSKTVRLT